MIGLLTGGAVGGALLLTTITGNGVLGCVVGLFLGIAVQTYSRHCRKRQEAAELAATQQQKRLERKLKRRKYSQK